MKWVKVIEFNWLILKYLTCVDSIRGLKKKVKKEEVNIFFSQGIPSIRSSLSLSPPSN